MVVYFDDAPVRKYLKRLRKDSQRKQIFAAASAKAALPIRRTARQKLKKSFNPKLAKFQERVNALNRGRSFPIRDRKKKTINLVKVKRGKRKYRGSAWIVGGLLANILENSKGGTATAKQMGVKGIPIVKKSGEVVFVKKIQRPKRNKYLSEAFDVNKGKTIQTFKIEVGKAVLKHARKHRVRTSKAASRMRSKTRRRL